MRHEMRQERVDSGTSDRKTGEMRSVSAEVNDGNGNILIFDPFSGISGDMILGSLVDAGVDADALRKGLEPLGLDGYEIKTGRVMSHGLTAVRCSVFIGEEKGHSHIGAHESVHRHPGGHPHRSFADIRKIIMSADLPDRVKERSLSVFSVLAEAEGAVHGMDPEDVHFHEVGAVDSIVDIVGTAVALELLEVERIYTRTVRLGAGTVEAAHGTLPIPAPATSRLLKGLSVIFDDEQGEMTTPTGAAVLSALAAPLTGDLSFDIMSVGYGAGSRTEGRLPDMLRVFLCNAAPDASPTLHNPENDDGSLILVETDIDDMNPELMPWLGELLFSAGVTDVKMTPTLMKKGRPGTTVSVLTRADLFESVCNILFNETSTLGIRWHIVRRKVLRRKLIEVETAFGKIGVKAAYLPDGSVKYAPEYDECVTAARKTGVPVRKIYEEAVRAAAGR